MTTQSDIKSFRDAAAELLETLRGATKSAFIPMQDPAMQQQMAQQGQMPPQGGPPMDPATQQQMMAQQGGGAPMDPAAMAQPAPGGGMDYGPIIDQIITGLEQLMQSMQEHIEQNAAEHQQMQQMLEAHEQKIEILVSAIDQPAPAPMGAPAQPPMM